MGCGEMGGIVRVIGRADGGVTVIHPVRDRRPGESTADYYVNVFNWSTKVNPILDGRPYIDMDPADLPDRKHRDRWRLVDGKLHSSGPK